MIFSRTDCPAGPIPTSVAIGDLNGDGKPDLAVADIGSNTVSVLLGNGDGSLQAQTTYATGFGPDLVAIGDLNGDGKPDLAVADEEGSVTVLLNSPPPIDQDSGEQAALQLTVNGSHPIGAATAGAVPFTVAGIESDDNGTVSFSDGSHAAVVVNIANGAPAATTANLAGLNDGPITATLHLNNDPAGNSFTNVVTNATLNTDRLAETPTLTAPSSLTVAAGGSTPLGIVLTAVDSDDTLSVSISGVPGFESVTAAGDSPTITKHVVEPNLFHLERFQCRF